MEGFFIDPATQTIQNVFLQQRKDKVLLEIKQVVQLILEVDIVDKICYNESYNLYYQKQQGLSKHKTLNWFKVEVDGKEIHICGSAILVPSFLEETLDLNNTITWVKNYIPPLKDFII